MVYKEMSELSDADIKKMTEKEAKEALQYYRDQHRYRYKFIIGEWQKNTVRAKSTQTGKFVSIKKVREYLG